MPRVLCRYSHISLWIFFHLRYIVFLKISKGINLENNTKYYFIILFDFSTHFRKKDLLFQYSFVVILFYVLNIVLKNETAETSMSLAMLVIVLLACFNRTVEYRYKVCMG